MKIYKSGYRNHWVSPYTILKAVCFWEKDDDVFYNHEEVPGHKYEKWTNRLAPFCNAWMKFLDFVHPQINYVKIDRYDTWSMDHTLADIILPMLKQLRESKHGAPYVDDEDVPEELKSTSAPAKENEWDTDDNHFKRWDWVMNEMVWAFEQELKDDDEAQFFDHSESRGIEDWEERMDKLKVDREGLEAHQKRKANGYRLFGRYYQNLWD